jgi:hypothetical protein
MALEVRGGIACDSAAAAAKRAPMGSPLRMVQADPAKKSRSVLFRVIVGPGLWSTISF